jgi:hypothetical protein
MKTKEKRAMKMLYRKCWKCGQVKDVFPYSKECRQCYQQGYYHESKVKLAAVDPATAAGYIAGTLKGVQLVTDCGLFSQLWCAARQEELLGAYEKLQAQINSTEETRALIDAQVDAADEVVKLELSEGAIEAESLEEAKRVFEAKDAELQRQQQERQQAMLERTKRDEEVRAKLAESASGARRAVASEKKAFLTGQ